MFLEFLIVFISTIACGLLFYQKWSRSYFARKGIYTLPEESHNQYSVGYQILRDKGIKYGGTYKYCAPYLLTTDLDFMKSMLIKNFDHFINHSAYFNDVDDPLSATLESLDNAHWKRLRTTVTPIFSTGKLKQMFPHFVEHSSALIEVLNEYAESNEPLHVKQIIERFVMDAIGSSAFGIELNSLKNENEDFQKTVKQVNVVDWRKLVTYAVNWRFLRFIRFKTCRHRLFNYFRDLVESVKEHRTKNNIFRKDLFQFLSQLENNKKIDGTDLRSIKHHSLTLNEITTQCFSFFVGGFDTSSSLMSLALLEIALNPDIQQKLRQNIQENLEKYDQFSYEAVKDMYFLEWVINETLRKHPPSPATNRCCNKTFPIPGTDIIIEPGVKVVIPIAAIHNDPEYYPEPDKFDPERFSPENAARRDPITFIPFGEGPRKCIGLRLALMEAKIGIATVINNFEVSVSEKTKQPITYSPQALLLTVEGGIWINLRKLT